MRFGGPHSKVRRSPVEVGTQAAETNFRRLKSARDPRLSGVTRRPPQPARETSQIHRQNSGGGLRISGLLRFPSAKPRFPSGSHLLTSGDASRKLIQTVAGAEFGRRNCNSAKKKGQKARTTFGKSLDLFNRVV